METKLKPLIILILALNLWANNLTTQQQNKLNTPIVKIKNNILTIEEYNSLNFDKKIFFDGQNLDKVVIKTKATMEQGVINKEQFIAISSTLSDQIMQSIFISPQYFLAN